MQKIGFKNKKSVFILSFFSLSLLSFQFSSFAEETSRFNPSHFELAQNLSPSQNKTTKKSIRGTSSTDTSSAQVESARIVSVKQKVELKSVNDDSWRKAKEKSSLLPSDKVRTGKKSIAKVKMEDGTTVLLLQNSEAEVENLSSLQRSIKLIRGKVRAIVTKLKGPGAFKIKTPIGVASVRGTQFEVELSEDGKEMAVNVLEGQVGVSRLGDLADEVMVNPGEKLQFGIEGEIGDPIKAGAIPMDQTDVRAEVQIDQVKNSVVAMAAEESRNADYQVGKSLVDVDGRRVRVEEYITRPAANQFKLVSLNERETRFDYFTYTGTFNQALPDDLSLALRDVGGKLSTTAPDYYLTDYQMLMSNTKDNITDSGTGGHLVKIELGSDGKYTLTDQLNNTRTVDAATLQSDGSYKIYNPIRDAFSYTSAANLAEAQNISVVDSEGAYKNFVVGDTFWKTRFDSSSYYINSTLKTAFTKKSSVAHTLAVDLDATFSNAPITTISEFPSGSGSLHNRLSLYFSDGSKTTYDNYIIDDEGNVASSTQFDGLSTSAEYKTELNRWNYQQKITATEMSDEINLVVDPHIGTISGLIQ